MNHASRLVSGKYPAPGTDPIADLIRQRRGPARGLTELDANLLHVPGVAEGYNTLLGAIRGRTTSEGRIGFPGDVREAMILRIAALNRAAYQWIQHVPLGREEGLSTGQLYAIRDVDTPLVVLKFPGGNKGARPPLFTPLQILALKFTDRLTLLRPSSESVGAVSLDLCERFKQEIRSWVLSQLAQDEEPTESLDLGPQVDDLYVEAAMVVATYNMVSRFLVSTDVAGSMDKDVPWPVERKEHIISIPSFPSEELSSSSSSTNIITHEIHALTLVTSPSAPWIAFANSLMTDWSMWGRVVPFFLDLPSSSSSNKKETEFKCNVTSSTRGPPPPTFNLLLHSQRGHGLSTLPPQTQDQDQDLNKSQSRLSTIPLLASDISHLLASLAIPTPIHALIGVSQGGAAALAFAALYGGGGNLKARSVVACDTAARTPVGNREAWEARVRGVFQFGRGEGEGGAKARNDHDDACYEYAKRVGMRRLAEVTVARWFPRGSSLYHHPGPGADVVVDSRGSDGAEVSEWVKDMIATKVDPGGFAQGARALGSYDVFERLTKIGDDGDDDDDGDRKPSSSPYYDTQVEHVLLLAGGLDGGGRVGAGMRGLCEDWNRALSSSSASIPGAAPATRTTTKVKYVQLGQAGHLPMVDSSEAFCESVARFFEEMEG